MRRVADGTSGPTHRGPPPRTNLEFCLGPPGTTDTLSPILQPGLQFVLREFLQCPIWTCCTGHFCNYPNGNPLKVPSRPPPILVQDLLAAEQTIRTNDSHLDWPDRRTQLGSHFGCRCCESKWVSADQKASQGVASILARPNASQPWLAFSLAKM